MPGANCLLIEPVWNRNKVSTKDGTWATTMPFNRTSLESKRKTMHCMHLVLLTFNRTSLESKPHYASTPAATTASF